jgi:signal transduction histidine kinase
VVEDYGAVRRLITRTRWFVMLRWHAAVAIVMAVIGTQWFFDIKLNAFPLFVVAGFLLFYNSIFFGYARWLAERPVEKVSRGEVENFANLQISVDLVVLTVLLHYSGGVENPLSLFFIFHMIIASILLTPLASYLQATLALGLYAAMALMEWQWPVLHHNVKGFLPLEFSQNVKFILGSIGALGVTLYLTVYLTVSIAKELRKRESQLMEARDRLEEANQKLAELEERKSRFMRVAAHQLRAPMAAISSSLKVVLGGYVRKDPAREQDMVERAVSRTQSMLTLLNDLLTLSRAKELPPEQKGKESFDLREVVEKLAALHKHRAEEKGIRLEVKMPEAAEIVNADRSAIEDVVDNLLSNAIKYTKDGGKVEVKTYERDGYFHCDVSDSGIGIPPDEMKELFTEFFRGSKAREVEHEGTGLGLSIVKEIVVRHGGDVAVQSEMDKGSTFSFKLPLGTDR